MFNFAPIILATAATTLALQASLSVDATLSNFVSLQTPISLQHVFENIQPGGGIAASPSNNHPDYWAHWIRDGALTMKSLLPLYEQALRSNDATNIALYESKFWAYVNHEHITQINSDNLGRPKFSLESNRYIDNWGHPQNDGAGLRAVTLIKFANLWLDVKGGSQSDIIKNNLYVVEFPAHSVIKLDLEYVTQAFLSENQNSNQDLWEETYARAHLYTRAAQRAALVEGAKFAIRMGDPGAAAWYIKIAEQIHNAIQAQHWSPSRQYLLETLDRNSGPNKPSGLDLGAVLAGLHQRDTTLDSTWGTDIARFDSGEILMTAMALSGRFKSLYVINNVTQDATGGVLAPAIGRYPEDTYDGYGNSLGNPWFLANNGFAELYFAIAAEWCTLGNIPLTSQTPAAINWLLQGGLLGNPSTTSVLPNNFGTTVQSCQANPTLFSNVLSALVQAGDAHIRRVKYHVPASNGTTFGYQVGSISEEYNRNSGAMQGAVELTWSHASFMSLSQQRAISQSATCACN